MARVSPGVVANRLFEGFLAPLVLGGELLPGRPIGARAALELGIERSVADSDLHSRVQLARTRVARRLAPVDRMDDATISEWALGAALHDLVQSTHPQLRGALRPRAPGRLLGLVDATVARVPAPASIGEALSRHTWFSRLLEIERTDTTVRWWVGSRTFLGTEPPPRLMAWPELRRVNVERTPRPLAELPGAGGGVEPGAFEATLARFLARTPLTDLACAARAAPAFAWSGDTLGLVATRGGRTLVLRALALAPRARVDKALGTATRRLLEGGAWKAASIAIELLGERALEEAEAVAASANRALSAGEDKDDAAFARAIGAVIARQVVATGAVALSEPDRKRTLMLLEARAASPAARQLGALLDKAAQPNPRA